ncbi:hypothetical protein PSACC_00192 [Paramicrosporidium saccamoebae]|uniref:deoxyhypusine synthase n=1 Tax=Paramicrosporidium saccamoebae TaxID=1246581 RepID=A0A2H9TQI9_9FUNG|nr:hypothetical protein PSACC_00192 [Paramicrosporidium saccamoebae]
MILDTESTPQGDVLLAAHNTTYVPTGQVPEGTPIIQGCDFNSLSEMMCAENDRLSMLMTSYLTTGFQATNLGLAIERVNEMLAWQPSPVEGEEADPSRSFCKIFLGYTSNQVSCGNREAIRYLVQHKLVHVLVTTAGGIEEDFMKCLKPHYVGDFHLDGKTLRMQGLNRIGNLIVPNDNYCTFEDWITPILDKVIKEQIEQGTVWTPSKLIHRLGMECQDESSIYYWAARNNIPVFCPAITDGAIGDMIYFHSYKQDTQLILDLVQDIRGINSEALRAGATGMLCLGGGLIKHHICNANLMRNGADFSVFINTGLESDGSDAGAAPDEAVSWGKIKMTAKPVKVTCEATIAFPLLVAETFAKVPITRRSVSMIVMALFYVVAGLQVEVSPDHLYHEVPDDQFGFLFSNLNFAHSDTRDGMVSLLSQWKYDLAERFESVSLDSRQAQKLVDSFISYPDYHPLVLPFKLVSKSNCLVEAMKSYWHLYRPGIISLSPEVPPLPSDQLKIVLSNLLEHPEWCGNRLTASQASSLFMDWDLRGAKPAIIENGLFWEIARRFHTESQSRYSTNAHANEFAELGQENWLQQYDNLLSILHQSWEGLCDARRALWHGRLLVVTLRMAPQDVVRKREIIRDFLLGHTISQIPPVIMDDILTWTTVNKTIYYRTENKSMLATTKAVHRLYPQYWSLSDDIDDHRVVWRSYLRSCAKVYRLTAPRDMELIKWWGSYDKLARVLLMSPKVPAVTFNSVTCESVVCLLEEMSSLLWKTIKLEDFSRKFIPSAEEQVVWRAFARTAASNILYRGQLGFPLPELSHWLCAKVGEYWKLPTVPVFISKHIASTNLRSYVKCELLNFAVAM